MKSLAWLSSCSAGGGPWPGRLCSFRGNTREPRQRRGVHGPSWVGVGSRGGESWEHMGQDWVRVQGTGVRAQREVWVQGLG